MDVRGTTIIWAMLAAFLLTGCLADRWVGVEPGQYIVANRTGMGNATALAEIQKLEIDRDQGLAIFTLVDKAESIVPFKTRNRMEWPSGCPTNINATHMEVLDLEQYPLTIRSMTFRQPVLVRGCPPDPIRVILREDGPIGGGGGACTHLDRCIFFERRVTNDLH
jgi:hypothetical protein